MSTSTKNLVEIHKYIHDLKNAILESKSDVLPISIDSLMWLLKQAKFVMTHDSMLVKTVSPIHICGDIHGQYNDLLKIFDRLGYPSKNNRYLFLGDYVDRGKQSIEVMSLLLCYKILYHNDVFLLRGNHESAEISRIYGFYDECKRRANIKLWKSFVDVFNRMPVAATIGTQENDPVIMCMHGGLSPSLTHINQINNIKRPCDIPENGLLCDLLWSDPDTENNRNGWYENDRGVSYVFGKNEIESFLQKNNLQLICRAHQVVEDGYEFFANRKLVTIFSAANYCGEFDNLGGVMTVSSLLRCSFTVFK